MSVYEIMVRTSIEVILSKVVSLSLNGTNALPLPSVMPDITIFDFSGAITDGTGVGVAVGAVVGAGVGASVGAGVGVGLAVGASVGVAVGAGVGVGVGVGVGLAVGVGVAVGFGEGVADVAEPSDVGFGVGFAVGAGAPSGTAVVKYLYFAGSILPSASEAENRIV